MVMVLDMQEVIPMNELVSRSADVALRLVLYRGEVYRFSPAGRGLRTLKGRAWVTYSGEDIFLARGDEVCLASGQGFALVSAVGRTPLILEVVAQDCRAASSILSPALSGTAGN
jgi:hypothetical protein